MSFFDASLGKSSSAKAQKGQAHFLSPCGVYKQTTISNNITRVVKSSRAAKGNALSSAVDEQLYLRLICQALWRQGPVQVDAGWEPDLEIPGVVADAKAVLRPLLEDWTYDCGKTDDA